MEQEKSSFVLRCCGAVRLRPADSDGTRAGVPRAHKSNAQEYLAGTIPTNAASGLVLYAVTNNPAAPGVTIACAGQAAGTVTIKE